MPTPAQPDHRAHHGSIKETLTSITIAFVLAFVFRAFVVEAFIIPTGSMAPTLLGAHVRAQSPSTGYTWAANERAGGGADALPDRLTDPMSQDQVFVRHKYLRPGDRILVLKYLYTVMPPTRYDSVVFKAPHEPQNNYIKRLVGLPGEQIALVDGDVFVRTPREGDPSDPRANWWALPGWEIARKSEAPQVAKALWMPLFSSEYTPLSKGGLASLWNSPWQAGGAGWEGLNTDVAYRYTGTGVTSLAWNARARPIDDRYPYNEAFFPNWHASERSPAYPHFPVSDVRMRANIRPEADGVVARAIVSARRHEFAAEINGKRVRLMMRAEGTDEWGVVVSEELEREAMRRGRVTRVAFWHLDQELQLWIDDRMVASHRYDWTPAERVLHSTGRTLEEIIEMTSPAAPNPLDHLEMLRVPETKVRWEFEGGPLILYRVGLDRDIHYRARERGVLEEETGERVGEPGLATHPQWTPTLGPNHFFMCGDNSPNSLDARLWGEPDGWVREIDPTIGVVHRDLVLGKAFFVYFPGPERRWGVRWLFVPDFGRLRFIW